METLLSSVSSSSSSSIKIPTLHPPPTLHHFLHFFRTTTNNTLPTTTSSAFFTTPKKTNFTTSTTCISAAHTNTRLVKTRSSPLFHTKAATGYAAALVDIAKLHNSLVSVHKGVRRLEKWLKNQQIMAIRNEREKGQVLMELADKGKLNKHVATLLRVLVSKGKLGIAGEVLDEFQRIYDELCGWNSTQLVALVPL